MNRGLIFFLFVLLLLHASDGDYFGGSVWWKFIQSYGDVTEIETRHSVFLSTDDACSVGEWNCTSGCSGVLVGSDATFASCDISNSAQGWKIAEYTARFNLSSDSYHIVQRTASCCWVKVDGSTPDFGLSYSVNVNPRSDTGLPNHPPHPVINPLIRLRHGCVKYVDIPVIDDEGDDVRCRFGQNEGECGSTDCGDYRYFSLDEVNCRLYYNAGGPADVSYGIRIVVEDFVKSTLEIGNSTFGEDSAISFATLQFTVQVYADDTSECNHEPFFVDPTPPDGQTISLGRGSTFTTTLYAAPSNSGWGIAYFLVLGVSNVAMTTVSTETSDVYQTDVQWSETASRSGTHLMCFVAVDSQRHSSTQRCLTLVVGESSDPCEANNGGCSDRCVWDGSASYICECLRSCWHLAADQRNCIPQFETKCGSDDITVSVPTCAVDGSIALSSFDTSSQDSTPNECRYSTNDTHYWFQFPFRECNTRVEEDLLELRYENSIRLRVDPDGEEGSGFITRGKWYNVAIRCSYPKYGTVNGTFTPVEQEVNLLSVPGLGTFTFFFNFFSDVSFSYAYSPIEYPISYVLNSDIFFGIEATGGSNLQLFTESCSAQPVADSGLSYDMIKDGCMEDDTLRNYQSESPLMENRFSIKAFRFRDGLPNITAQTNVFIQCAVRLCLAGDNSTRCYQGCVPSTQTRKKRNLDGQTHGFLNSLSRGRRQTTEVRETLSHAVGGKSPIRIQIVLLDSNETVVIEKDIPESDGSQRTLIIIAAGVGALIILLLIATIIYTCYQAKQRKQLFAIKPYGSTLWPERGKWAVQLPPPYFEGGERKA